MVLDQVVPDEPFGPNALGHTSLIGEARRQNGYPVLRDELVKQVDDLDAVDIPDDPVFPVLDL